MKKLKSLIFFIVTILTLTTIFCLNVSAESEFTYDFNSKSGILYVEGKGELKNIYDLDWTDDDCWSDCEHGANELCSTCWEYSIKHLIIGEGITSIDHCFFNLYNLKTLSLPSTLKEIKGGSFIECRNLKTVDIPESVTVIDNAFNYCTNLQWINIPKNIKVLCGFGYAKFRYLEIPRTVKKLALACNTIESIYIPETITANMLKATGYVNEYCDHNTKESDFYGIHTKSKKLTVTSYDKSAAKDWAKKNNHKFNQISPIPEKITAKNYSKHVLLSWDKVENTDKWNIYRLEKGTKTWKKIATIDNNFSSYEKTLTFKDTTTEFGKVYTYRLFGDKNKMYVQTNLGRILRPENVEMYSTSAKTAVIKWNKVNNAKYYYVYEKYMDGTYKNVAKVNAKYNYYTFKNIDYSSYTVYEYIVRAHDGTSISPVSESVRFVPGQTKLVSMTANTKSNTITIKWVTTANLTKANVMIGFFDHSAKKKVSETITVKASKFKTSGNYTYITVNPKEIFTKDKYKRIEISVDAKYKEVQANKYPLRAWMTKNIYL